MCATETPLRRRAHSRSGGGHSHNVAFTLPPSGGEVKSRKAAPVRVMTASLRWRSCRARHPGAIHAGRSSYLRESRKRADLDVRHYCLIY